MKNSSRKQVLSLGIALLLVFGLFFILSSNEEVMKIELKKVTFPFTFQSKSDRVSLLLIDNRDRGDDPKRKGGFWNVPGMIADSTGRDTNITYPLRLSSGNQGMKGDTTAVMIAERDSLVNERVLLIGDSQLEGLRDPVYNYCVENHHKLVSTVLWYGSSTKQWGITDTLDYFIRKYNPTIVLVALGLNELFVRDLPMRQQYIANILDKFKTYQVDYFWIGPAAWTKDKGIIEVMKTKTGKNFYPSHMLKLARAADKRHPSRNAARIWFDSVATYVTKSRKIDFSKRSMMPVKRIDSPLIVLQIPK